MKSQKIPLKSGGGQQILSDIQRLEKIIINGPTQQGMLREVLLEQETPGKQESKQRNEKHW